MRSRAFVVLCLGAVALAACNFPSANRPAMPRVGATPAGNIAVAGEYLSGVRVVSYDPFDNLRNWKWQPSTGALKEGVFEMQGTSFWHSHLLYRQDFTEGQGLLLNFSVRRANGDSELVLVSGEWLTDSFRQFGVYNAPHPLTDLFQGTADAGGKRLPGNLTLRPNSTYEVLLAVGYGGRSLALVWDPASPSDRAGFEMGNDAAWAGRTWTFMPKATDGETIDVDNFYKITFTDVK